MQNFDRKKLSLEQSVLRILYRRYKLYVTPIAIIFVSAMLFMFFVIPQVQEIFVIKAQEDLTREKIANLQKNIEFVASLNDAVLDSQVQTVSGTLPGEKDFMGVLNAITGASVKSGVSVGDYVFQVGSLSQKSENVPEDMSSFPSLSLSLELKGGGVEGARQFLNTVAKIIPISEVNNIEAAERGSRMTMVFYYKAIPPIVVDYTIPMKPLSPKQESTLGEVSSWVLSPSNSFFDSFASPSAGASSSL